jgi:hypothetical protein
MIMIAMVVTVGVLAAAVVGAVTQLRHDSRGPATAGRKAVAATHAAPTPSSSPSPTSSPSSSASAPPSSPRAGKTTAPGITVTVSSAVAGNPAAPQVRDFLDRYFTAINEHDYQAYAELLDQTLARSQQAAFTSGFGSTTDSDAALDAISDDQATGVLAASVTFTSHQRPADSPDDSPCDDWAITLYLTPHAGSYVIVSPPSSYGATHHAC